MSTTVKSIPIQSTGGVTGENFVPPVVFTFELSTGNTGTKVIIDPMLSTKGVAQARATSEFLQHGYIKKGANIRTARTNLMLNNIISVKGLKFKILSMLISSNEKSIITSIKGLRYEQ